MIKRLTQIELQELEREIAVKAARWTIASHVQDWDEGWLDVGHGGLPHVINAARFLDAISDPRFERHPDDVNLVRVKEQEKGDE